MAAKISVDKKLDKKIRGVTTVPVTPSVLLWTRKKAGFSLEIAAQKAKIHPVKVSREVVKTPAELLGEWENGMGTPTARQLEEIAKVYRRPVITFFLPAPPKESTLLADFRTLRDHAMKTGSPEFMAVRRRIEAIFYALQEIETEEGGATKSFVGSFPIQKSSDALIENMRQSLDYSFEDQIKCANPFKMLRQKLHESGVYVLCIGNLGSHHSNVDPSEFRGMSIANPLVPMIIINPNDVDAAQLFTLVHEMAHIWLGESGISNIGLGDDLRAPTVSHKELESYCNAVAAEFLVPQAKVKELYRGSHIENLSLEEQVEKLSQHFKVSRPVIARKLLDMNQMTEREYWDLYGVYRKQWQEQRALQRQKEGGAPPRYKVLMPYYFGNKLVHRLLAAAQDGLLSSQEVSRLINVPVSHFKELEP